MTLQDAPSEVLDQIFHFLPQSSVWECILVCKTWNATAVPVYYTTIQLTNTKTARKLVATLSNPQHKYQSVNRGLWVKNLSFDINISPQAEQFNLPPQDFQTLISNFTYLKTIDLTSLEKQVIPFLTILSTANNEEQNLLLPSCIEEIKVDADIPREGKELHFLANYAYKTSIKRLHLNYLRNTSAVGGYLDLLPQFKSLTHLSIYNDLLTGDRYMVIYPVLEACPNLVAFQLHTTRHFPDGSQPILLSLIEQDLQSMEAAASRSTAAKNKCVTNYTKINRNIYLKHLDFHIKDFDEAYMKYIIHYTPKQLESFKLFMCDADFYDWLIEKEKIVNQFGQNMSNVKNLDISAYTPGVHIRRINGLLRPTPTINDVSAEEKMMRHWTFIDAVIGDRKLHCHVYLATNGYHDYQNFKLKVIDNSTMILRYSLKPTHPHNNLISVLTPHTIAGCVGPGIIDSLELADAVRYTLKDCLETVEYALKHCPRLKFMVITRAELCYRFESLSSPNAEFDKLKIKVGEGRDYIKQQQKHHVGNELNHVSFSGAILSPELLSTLCQFIPKMQVLKLNECTIPKDINGRVTLNLKGIQHLHYLELDITHIVLQAFGYIFISFELGRGDVFCYKSKMQPREVNFIPVETKYLQDFQTFNNNSNVKASFITIQCDKIDMVTIKTVVSLKNTTLKTGVDTIPNPLPLSEIDHQHQMNNIALFHNMCSTA